MNREQFLQAMEVYEAFPPLSELERDGLLYSERTTGRYITQDAALIERTRRQMAEKLMAAFVEQMEHMGYKTTGDILQGLRQYLQG